jgi:aspartyl-tRNA(Asn)/glutamyl-tRNA(Gln) amidotransferase subunit A
VIKISEIADQLGAGTLSARDHLERCLEAADSKDGRLAFISMNKDAARLTADHIDLMRAQGAVLPRFAGVTLSVKDLFDIAGQVTRAGSIILNDAPAATSDAVVVHRLRAAGFNIIGRTNMTEFAYSGLGMNAHYGNPRSPFERHNGKGRIAGGSSSGSAVSIADGMAAATIGTDTGGSTRVPAAFCGIVGMKPSTRRMPAKGVYPLSTSLDAAGPMGSSVECCALLDSIMAGGNSGHCETPFGVQGLRLALPRGYLFETLDVEVARDFDAAIDRLSAAGAIISDITIDVLEDLRPANRPNSIAAAEAFAIHRSMITSNPEKYDPDVGARILAGGQVLAADYIAMHDQRTRIAGEVAAITRPFDALVLPTSPAIAMALDDLEGTESAATEKRLAASARALRNTALSNYLDRPTITLPCHAQGTAPVGLSLMGTRGHDRRLLAIAAGAEASISLHD